MLYKKIVNYLINNFAPWHYCKLCALPCRDFICSLCINELDQLPTNLCKFCQHNDLDGNNTLCQKCRDQLNFKNLYCNYQYTYPLDKLIHACKYQSDSSIAYALGTLITSIISKVAPDHNLIIPMPLHELRQLTRGFNQSQYLLQHYIDHFGNEKINYQIISRVKNTATQTTLNSHARHDNLTHAFCLNGRVENLKILIIDDIITTGASCKNLSNLLYLHGAKEVNVCTLARTMPHLPYITL